MTDIIVIVGPTASGKTALAVALARQFNGEVLSADSRQVYRGLDIGTGKVTPRERRGVPHHLLDIASPRRRFTADQYVRKFRAAVSDITRRGKLPIVAGGTAFYIDAALGRTTLGAVPPNPTLRKKLEKLSTEDLFKKLERLDPRRADTIDRHNPRRLIRALEIASAAPVPRPTVKPYTTLTIGLQITPETLKRRIHDRLERRWRNGLLQEVRALRRSGLSDHRLEDLGLEYRSVSRYLRGLISRDEATQKIETESWQYAKRQLTWWKRDRSIHWITRPAAAIKLVNDFLAKKRARHKSEPDAVSREIGILR